MMFGHQVFNKVASLVWNTERVTKLKGFKEIHDQAQKPFLEKRCKLVHYQQQAQKAIRDGSSLTFTLKEVIEAVNEMKGKCDSIEKELNQQ